MKFKKPEIVPMFKTTSGATVETLELWKQSELESLLEDAFEDNVPPAAAVNMAKFLMANAEAFVAILGVVERRGRPVGAKDKQPRKKVVLPKIIKTTGIDINITDPGDGNLIVTGGTGTRT